MEITELADVYTKQIYSQGDISIEVKKVATQEVINLLGKTVYGTIGPKYRHTGHINKLADIQDPYFFYLRVGSKLAGTYCISGRIVECSAGSIQTYYRRYFSIDPAYHRKGLGTLLVGEVFAFINKMSTPSVSYGYIEEFNQSSLKCSANNKTISIGKMEALIFSRFYPKINRRFGRLEEGEVDTIKSLLRDAYKDYQLVQLEKVYFDKNYFVLREGDQIIAGVQAMPVKWEIIYMPKFIGYLTMHIVPHLPIISKLVNPKNHRFLALEALYVKPGYEAQVITLLESVLAHFNHYSAIIMLDVKCPIHQLLQSSGKLGLLNSMKTKIYSHVMVKTHGIDDSIISELTEKPVYISSFDCT